MAPPFLSVIVPVYNGGPAFRRCLNGLAAGRFRDYELIVVDDGSTDGSAALAAEHGARVLQSGPRGGPGAARNVGAREARGEALFFLDADCEPHPDTLETAARVLREEPDVDAVFGSYDDDPDAPGFVAQYKNLFHHYVHQQADPEATTFWAGCGAVRRRVFDAVGGFDPGLFPRPSIEDIELGYRLRERGHRIRLCHTLRVKHLKAWTLESVLRSDVLDRGIPWTELMLRRGGMADELNVGWRHRISVVAAWLLLVCLPGIAWSRWLALPAAASAAWLFVANLHFYRFFARRRGILFALRVFPLHWLYFLYCAIAFGWGALRHLAARRRERDVAIGSS